MKHAFNRSTALGWFLIILFVMYLIVRDSLIQAVVQDDLRLRAVKDAKANRQLRSLTPIREFYEKRGIYPENDTNYKMVSE